MNRNVLVTSAGRRVSLIRGFIAVCEGANRSVHAADAQPEFSAACHVADGSHALPFVSASGYVEALAELCSRLDIGLVVPAIDTELQILAAHRQAFAEQGTHIAVSDSSFVATCEDKRRTKALFDDLGLDRPDVYAWPDIPRYPVFAKPYDGSASQGTAVITSETEARLALESSDRAMLCEYIDPVHHDEYTIDCYFDRESVLRCVVPRLRIKVRGGEVAQAQTAKNELVDELFEKAGRLIGARGIVTFQAFVHRQERTRTYIEINARVGGGYPLTRHAGADYQRMLVDEYLNGVTPATFHGWRSGARMLRYDAEVVIFDV